MTIFGHDDITVTIDEYYSCAWCNGTGDDIYKSGESCECCYGVGRLSREDIESEASV